MCINFTSCRIWIRFGNKTFQRRREREREWITLAIGATENNFLFFNTTVFVVAKIDDEGIFFFTIRIRVHFREKLSTIGLENIFHIGVRSE